MNEIGVGIIAFIDNGTILIGYTYLKIDISVDIDEVLLWSINIQIIMLLIECVCIIFKK